MLRKLSARRQLHASELVDGERVSELSELSHATRASQLTRAQEFLANI